MSVSNIHFNPSVFSGGRFSSSAQSGWDIYWLIGQSNMVGEALIRSGIDDDYSSVSGRVFQFGFDSQSVTAAANALDHVNENYGRMGLWLEFVKSRIGELDSSRNILLVPCAKGGSSFSRNDWNPGNTLYSSALARLASAMADGSGANRLCGALWLQGESDADDGVSSANAYSQNLQAMYSAMVASAAGMTASTPFIVGSIKPDKSRANIINASLQAFATGNAAARYVDLTDLSFIDGDHYTASSLATAGQRYAGAFL